MVESFYCNKVSIMLAQRSLELLIVVLLAEWPNNSSIHHSHELARLYESIDISSTCAQSYANSTFIVVPRSKTSIAVTLLKLEPAINQNHGADQSTLQPFPSWQLQEEGACDKFAIQTAVDVFLDNKSQLWVLDTGVCNTLTMPVLRCQPKIVAIDARTGEISRNIVIRDLTRSNSRLQYLVVDQDAAENRFIYISDASTRAIIVWNVKTASGHRLTLPEFVTMGCTTLDRLYIALVHKSSGSFLFFTYLGSSRLFSLATRHLQTDPQTAADYIIDCGSKPHGLNMELLGTDQSSHLYIRYKGHSDIFVWDTEQRFEASNFKEVLHNLTRQVDCVQGDNVDVQ